MRISISSNRFNASQNLQEYIENKLQKLEQFHDKITQTNVSLKLENTGQVKDKIVEVKLLIPGDMLVVKSSAKTFEAAVDKSLEGMKRRIKKIKQLRAQR
ncbi:MAG: ribosome-associated translation inhibitor RaiA [Bacteroidia bacterium]|nr:ribosome-associated translation inhibitor RaiA [Bacteroidia bacterium]